MMRIDDDDDDDDDDVDDDDDGDDAFWRHQSQICFPLEAQPLCWSGREKKAGTARSSEGRRFWIFFFNKLPNVPVKLIDPFNMLFSCHSIELMRSVTFVSMELMRSRQDLVKAESSLCPAIAQYSSLYCTEPQ